MPLSAERTRQARAMRNSGMRWEHICREIGASYYIVRSALDKEWGEATRRKTNMNRHRRKGEPATVPRDLASKLATHPNHVEPVMRVPAEVLADREQRATLQPASLTAAVFGDPLPGRSALDRRRGA